MTETLLTSYELTIYSWGALGALLLIQLLVTDVLSIKARHVPGTAPEQSHDNALFRASRVVGNTNESLGIYIVLVLFCVFNGANADYTAWLSWAYVACRAAYALCYYLRLAMARSLIFGLSLLVLIGMLVVGVTG
jgi:uncharacterized MAPEG superfamily protein